VGTQAQRAGYSLQYDVLNDFKPLCPIAANPQTIIAKNAMLLARLIANPGEALICAGAPVEPP
jgi:hypothetical protein